MSRKRGEEGPPREETKTGSILGQLQDAPEQSFSPKEVAEALSYELPTTTTILTRLVEQGHAVKDGRGRYRARPNQTVVPMKPDQARAAYKVVYKAFAESIGAMGIPNLTKLEAGNADGDPVPALRKLVDSLGGIFGPPVAAQLVRKVLEKELGPDAPPILKELKI